MSGFAWGLLAGAAVGAAAASVLWAWRHRRLGKFFSHGIHEMNTPMTAIQMTVVNFVDGLFGEVPKAQREWLDLLRDQTLRLSELLGEFRDFNHFFLLRDLHPFPEDVPLKELVDDAAAAQSPGAGRLGMRIVVAGALPDLSVHVDRDRAARILSSLLFYARKNRSEGDILLSADPWGTSHAEIKISFQSAPDGQRAIEEASSVFFPARKGGQMTSGWGLGLVRRLVLLQGGDLAVASPGPGPSVLALRLPLSGRNDTMRAHGG